MFICLSLLFAFTLFLSVFSSKLRNAASLGIGLTFCMGFLIIGNKEYLGGETLPDLQMYKEFFLQKENIDNIELSWSFLRMGALTVKLRKLRLKKLKFKLIFQYYMSIQRVGEDSN